jgi:hypothetical protein
MLYQEKSGNPGRVSFADNQSHQKPTLFLLRNHFSNLPKYRMALFKSSDHLKNIETYKNSCDNFVDDKSGIPHSKKHSILFSFSAHKTIHIKFRTV